MSLNPWGLACAGQGCAGHACGSRAGPHIAQTYWVNGPVVVPRESRRSRRKSKRTTTLWLVSGEILITAGILLGLFWVWYLFINDWIHASSQTQASVEVSEAWEDDVFDGVVKIPNPQGLSIDPPTVEAVEAGEPFAILYVPRFGPDYQRTIAGGVDLATALNDSRLGVGHYDESSLLGELGNFAIAGHRTSFGAAFADIAELVPGDTMYIETDAGWYSYVFRNLDYVLPTTVEVLLPVPRQPGVEPTERLLTLTSCHPRFSDAERIIAYAVYEAWYPRGNGPPADIAQVGKRTTSCIDFYGTFFPETCRPKWPKWRSSR